MSCRLYPFEMAYFCLGNKRYSKAIEISYLNLHVEMSLLALFPLLGLHPFLLLQTLHQLLWDVHVSHWLEHLTWEIKKV